MDKTIATNKVFDAISALKERASKQEDDFEKEIDLISIVKKLSKNRSRAARSEK